jgi:hypothetical protein
VTSRRIGGIVFVALVLTMLGACGAPTPRVAAVDSAPRRVDLRYVIPRGTTARVARGEAVRILPARLKVHVGQVIQIVNRDDHGQVLGPFYVAASSTMTERFQSPGRLIGRCTVHLSGKIELDVSS